MGIGVVDVQQLRTLVVDLSNLRAFAALRGPRATLFWEWRGRGSEAEDLYCAVNCGEMLLFDQRGKQKNMRTCFPACQEAGLKAFSWFARPLFGQQPRERISLGRASNTVAA